ncbi:MULTISPECIES: helix-turn-helix domain-containing protein [unclassified Comamonas]|uniref:helix-turn-helix domain-containing protein n=1 Tax=unclassified Comamonas TaxID=2638500 RepID=UPI000EB3CB2E|nr:helix-turn-helix transcriptional regulator [Comamonas sp. lk]
MTAFSDAFRTEVLRMARKEIKGELGGLRKTVATQRAEIASLKRSFKDLVSELRTVKNALQPGGRDVANHGSDEPSPQSRRFQFDAHMLVAKRQTLGISQQAMATLLEASTLSVSRWESGKVVPRATQMERIRLVLKIGKREARARLQG